MNLLEEALPELSKLIDSLPVDTSDAHATFKAVLANLHVRLQNVESFVFPVVEQAAKTLVTDAVEAAVK
jgi:hypothetical protein